MNQPYNPFLVGMRQSEYDRNVRLRKQQEISLSQENITEDADFEIIDNRNCVFDVKRIEDRLIELGALEDAEFEVIEPKQQ
jgi:hypothetical protein